jgi:formiminoglutamase
LAFKHIFKTDKVIAIDVVELNPKYDENSITAILAAQIINLACRFYLN